MLTRRDLADLGITMNDEEWAKFLGQLDQIADQIWEEDHPQDE